MVRYKIHQIFDKVHNIFDFGFLFIVAFVVVMSCLILFRCDCVFACFRCDFVFAFFAVVISCWIFDVAMSCLNCV